MCMLTRFPLKFPTVTLHIYKHAELRHNDVDKSNSVDSEDT
jgi:hypothetical protein